MLGVTISGDGTNDGPVAAGWAVPRIRLVGAGVELHELREVHVSAEHILNRVKTPRVTLATEAGLTHQWQIEEVVALLAA